MVKSKNADKVTAAPTVADNTPKTYIVVRDGFRVSNKEYSLVDDPDAVAEKEFWEKVSTNYSHGESVKIIEYNSRLHRVW